MAGVASWAMLHFGPGTVAVLLLMALAAIHCPRTLRGCVVLVHNTRMAGLAVYLPAMDRGIEVINGDMKGAFPGPIPVAPDTVLLHIAPGITDPKNHDQSNNV